MNPLNDELPDDHIVFSLEIDVFDSHWELTNLGLMEEDVFASYYGERPKKRNPKKVRAKCLHI